MWLLQEDGAGRERSEVTLKCETRNNAPVKRTANVGSSSSARIVKD
jgi:hypothetical protein